MTSITAETIKTSEYRTHCELHCGPSLLRGIATGWTGVDMSTPLLPEVVPEIDANVVSFYSRGGGWRVGHGLELDSPFASVR